MPEVLRRPCNTGHPATATSPCLPYYGWRPQISQLQYMPLTQYPRPHNQRPGSPHANGRHRHHSLTATLKSMLAVTPPPGGGRLLLADDGSTECTLRLLAFDPETGAIGPVLHSFANPQAQLSFPHALAFSADGRYLAVSNYGNDKLLIVAMNATATVPAQAHPA